MEVNLNKNDKGELLPPPEGRTVFVNPREDEPLDFCRLDFLTFEFSIIAQKETNEYIRADYTYNNVLRLNQREGLRERRKNAFHDYKDRLNAYTLSKNLGKSQDKLDKMIQRLKTSDHPTVWKEMQRQHRLGRLIKIDSDLDNLFQQLPEALTW